MYLLQKILLCINCGVTYESNAFPYLFRSLPKRSSQGRIVLNPQSRQAKKWPKIGHQATIKSSESQDNSAAANALNRVRLFKAFSNKTTNPFAQNLIQECNFQLIFHHKLKKKIDFFCPLPQKKF